MALSCGDEEHVAAREGEALALLDHRRSPDVEHEPRVLVHDGPPARLGDVPRRVLHVDDAMSSRRRELGLHAGQSSTERSADPIETPALSRGREGRYFLGQGSGPLFAEERSQ